MLRKNCSGVKQIGKILGLFEKMVVRLQDAIISIDQRVEDNNVEISALTAENNALVVERAKATKAITRISALVGGGETTKEEA